MDNIYASDLFKYSEWLDSQSLMVGTDESADKRTHEELVRDFLRGRDE